MNVDDLNKIALEIVSTGKGILAADESTPTIKKRFDTIGVESTETNRKNYRNMLFTTDGVSKYISGVILFDETIRQQSPDGTAMVDVLTKAGIIPGIKVDKGAKSIANAASETVTEGLDGLRERLTTYYQLDQKNMIFDRICVLLRKTYNNTVHILQILLVEHVHHPNSLEHQAKKQDF